MSNMKAVYIISGKGERKFWTKIGVAFVNRDGSLNVKLEALPTDGQLHIRDMVVKDDTRRDFERPSYDKTRGDDVPF